MIPLLLAQTYEIRLQDSIPETCVIEYRGQSRYCDSFSIIENPGTGFVILQWLDDGDTYLFGLSSEVEPGIYNAFWQFGNGPKGVGTCLGTCLFRGSGLGCYPTTDSDTGFYYLP